MLKDAWNPRQEHSEGSLYEHLGKLDGLAQCDRWGQVTIDGRLDDTDRLICQSFTDLHPLGKALKLGSEKIEDSVSVDGNRPKDSAGQICKLQQQPEPRDHHRVLLATLGWPLCEFFNLRELLTVLHDAVGGKSASILWVRQ